MHNCHADILAYHDDEVTLPKSEQDEMRERRDTNRRRLKNGLDPHASPYLRASDHAEDLVEHPPFSKHAPESFHQRTNPILGPVGKVVIQHQSLTKQ